MASIQKRVTTRTVVDAKGREKVVTITRHRARWQLVKLAGRPADLAPPKTKASVRDGPLPHVVVDALAEHLAAYPVG